MANGRSQSPSVERVRCGTLSEATSGTEGADDTAVDPVDAGPQFWVYDDWGSLVNEDTAEVVGEPSLAKFTVAKKQVFSAARQRAAFS